MHPSLAMTRSLGDTVGAKIGVSLNQVIWI